MQQSQKGQVRLYAAGGAGMNIGSQMEMHRNTNEKSFANLDIVYLDTSRSNLNKTIAQDSCYLIDGLDGSGKVRAENHEQISQHIRVILQKFEPTDLNIVLHSTAGGSGSVIGPLLASELLASNVPTVVVAVGSADTLIEANNSLKTLKSYAAISDMRELPLILSYSQNSADKGRETADAVAVRTVLALCALFSRENFEMDSKDIQHWLRFDKTTSFRPQLASLTLVEAGDEVPNLGNVISVATLAKRSDRTALDNAPEYQTVGFLADDADDSLRSRAPLHFIISDGVLAQSAKVLQGVVDKFQASGGIRQQSAGLLAKGDRPVGTGLVL